MDNQKNIPTKEELSDLYIKQNLRDGEIAMKLGVSPGTVWKWRKQLEINGIHPQQRQYANNPEKPLSERQYQILMGSLLGDACIKPQCKRAILSISHCEQQKEYLYWLYNEFKDICKQPPQTYLSHGKYITHYFSSIGRLDLMQIYASLYTPNKTIIPQWLEKITPLSLAVWYSDDGHLKYKNKNRSVFTFATNSFSQDEHFLLKKTLLEKFDLHTNIQPVQRQSGMQYNLCVEEKSSDRFEELISSYIVPSMRYKLRGELQKSAIAGRLINDGITKDLLEDLYYNKKLTQKQIGMIINKHVGTVRRYMEIFKIERRDKVVAQLAGKNNSVNRNQCGKFESRGLTHEEQNNAKEIFQTLRQGGFPYKELKTDEQYLGAIDRLYELSLENYKIGSNEFSYSRVGMDVCNDYCQQIMTMGAEGSLSPVQIFNNDDMLLDCICRTMKYTNKSSVAAIRSGLKTYKGNRAVTVFPPAWAKLIINDLYDQALINNMSVLDFCCGFGGRLLGSYASGSISKYVGIDPITDNINTHFNINRLIQMHAKQLNLSFLTEFIVGCAEDILPKINEKFDIVMTSPPYFNKEIYTDNSQQSYHRFPIYKDWLEKWFQPILIAAWEKLKSGGKMIIIVSNIDKYTIADDCEKIMSSISGQPIKMYKLQIPTLEYLRAKEIQKYDHVLVSKKV